MKPLRVLFVCLGNICRSPMAEGVFRHLVKEAGLEGRFEIDSAGIGGWHVGEPPHHGTRRMLAEKGVDATGLVCRQIRPADLDQFDYVVGMDRENVAALHRLHLEGKSPKACLLLEYAGEERRGQEVPDPYYTGRFAEVYDLVLEGCRGLLAQIRAQENF